MINEKWSRWIGWSGGECPLLKGQWHEIQFRNGYQDEDNMPECRRWQHNGGGKDIIAYRYKIKEPESDMHPDLEFLARNISEWGVTIGSYNRILLYNGNIDYCQSAGCDLDGTFKGHRTFTKTQWQAARQQLGLDQPEVTPEEDEAWQAKEQQLIGGPRKAESFLHQAAELLTERGKQYDQPGGERSMGKTIGAFNIITGRDLTEAEGWLIMTLLKRVRQYSGQGYHKDSAEDGVTYGALEAEALEANE